LYVGLCPPTDDYLILSYLFPAQLCLVFHHNNRCPRNEAFTSLTELKMSFGGPGGRQVSVKPIPPERGSFPLE
jgi:hypothetical protein